MLSILPSNIIPEHWLLQPPFQQQCRQETSVRPTNQLHLHETSVWKWAACEWRLVGSFILLVWVTAEESCFRCCNYSCRKAEPGVAGLSWGPFLQHGFHYCFWDLNLESISLALPAILSFTFMCFNKFPLAVSENWPQRLSSFPNVTQLVRDEMKMETASSPQDAKLVYWHTLIWFYPSLHTYCHI